MAETSDNVKTATDAKKAPAPQVPRQSGADGQPVMRLLMDIPLTLRVELGSTRIPVRDLLRYQEGEVIELDQDENDALDVYVNDKLIARGEPVVVDGKVGLRLTEVVSAAERLENINEGGPK